jgi:hypothetical protein
VFLPVLGGEPVESGRGGLEGAFPLAVFVMFIPHSIVSVQNAGSFALAATSSGGGTSDVNFSSFVLSKKTPAWTGEGTSQARTV